MKAHAIITGGSSGIGLATARLLAARGTAVSLIARGVDRLETAADELRSTGAVVRSAAVDVSEQPAVLSAIAGFVEDAGPCDLLVTSAGLARPGRFLELDDDVFRQMMEVDYFGTLHCIRAVAPAMVKAGRGSIMAVSSGVALFGYYGYSAYAPAKFAVRGLMESLRNELSPHGVHIGCVYPPDVDTPQLAEENQFKPAETAAVSGAVKPMTAEAVAASIVRAIDRKQFAVYPDRSLALLSGVVPALAPVFRRFLDYKTRRASR